MWSYIGYCAGSVYLLWGVWELRKTLRAMELAAREHEAMEYLRGPIDDIPE